MTAPARKPRPRPRQARREASGVEAFAGVVTEMQADIRALYKRIEAMSPPPLPPLPPGFVNLRTAARESGFSAEAVRLWAVAGAIGALRRGGAWFVKLADVVAHARGGKLRSG
jgi:hypothetical protein